MHTDVLVAATELAQPPSFPAVAAAPLLAELPLALLQPGGGLFPYVKSEPYGQFFGVSCLSLLRLGLGNMTPLLQDH